VALRHIESHDDAAGAPGVFLRLHADLHIDLCPIFPPMRPDLGRSPRPVAGQILLQPRRRPRIAQIEDRHLQKLAAVIAVKSECGFVGLKQVESLPIEDEHRAGIALE